MATLVKIQLPLAGNETPPRALIYDKTKQIHFVAPINDDLARKMDGRAKAFFEIEIVGGQFVILKELPDQGW
jgi:hypothetical protein